MKPEYTSHTQYDLRVENAIQSQFDDLTVTLAYTRQPMQTTHKSIC